jgi:hypothetical protein
MQVLIIHSTETEEILGMVTPKKPIDFDKFDDEVRRTWTDFQKDDVRNRWAVDNDYEEDMQVGEFSIEDFVDFHNTFSYLDIDWVVSDYIQL